MKGTNGTISITRDSRSIHFKETLIKTIFFTMRDFLHWKFRLGIFLLLGHTFILCLEIAYLELVPQIWDPLLSPFGGGHIGTHTHGSPDHIMGAQWAPRNLSHSP